MWTSAARASAVVPVATLLHRGSTFFRRWPLRHLAVVGFWPTYFGRLVAGTVPVPSVIHLHAAVLVTWLLLFWRQVGFAASGRIRLHIRLGSLDDGLWASS